MRGFLYCLIYTLVVGWSLFFLGRLIPKGAFNPERFPLKTHDFEKKLYVFLRVKKWQKNAPDMSRIFLKLMIKKQASLDTDYSLMIHETCVAEIVHAVQSILGFACLALWEGAGGVIVSVGYFFGNTAFVIIQRYNRPRLQVLEKASLRHSACIAGKAGDAINDDAAAHAFNAK